MDNLENYMDYGFIQTPVFSADKYAKHKNLKIKLEQYNLNNNIKSRTAFFIVQDMVKRKTPTNVVESSSGNLGFSLGYFLNKIGYNFLCLIDEYISEEMIDKLRRNSIQYKVITKGNFIDGRTARIEYAKKLNTQEDWIWTNQYSNPANTQAHFSTTGPELFKQLNGNIDYFVCSVGSGGTIAGVSKYLKSKNENIQVIAVEPKGSTIFGGSSHSYISAGAGFYNSPDIVSRHRHLIDKYAKVEDDYAISTCIEFEKTEGISVGITTGAVLYVAQYLSFQYPDKIIACISPDDATAYQKYFKDYNLNINEIKKPVIEPVNLQE